MDPILGSIILFAGNFAPRGWALCNGQLLSISQNTALFAILGTTYGGDGRTTFALPDLRGRTPIHAGDGRGLTHRNLGEMGGEEAVTLLPLQMPAHTHTAMGRNDTATRPEPERGVWAAPEEMRAAFRGDMPNVAMHPAAISLAGGSQPHDNMPPFLAMNYIIATQGVFPSRE